ncbi:MAG: DegT/DnrJ/EryC1/StrS family aminotransferase [Bacteriovoracaceae bacterium]|nr:DegT/DnrJ/EryC1/StrS family aminotransferase [Bacteriovoracaceae bacterium]
METYNYLPDQYKETNTHQINHNYLKEQFDDYPEILNKIAKLVHNCDYTLGQEVDIFEERFKDCAGSRYALGVGSGTGALFLSMKAIDLKEGDEVITTPYTFFATIGSIVTAGGRPVFIDCKEDYNIDPSKIERAITPKTKAILPVHWSGHPCDMDEIMAIANKHKLHVIEDACHGIKATYKGKGLGSFGTTGCFSMHPLKNLNVWGDGGVVTTNDEKIYKKLSLLRNHGLINRNECEIFGYNCRLDTLQAIVANHLMDKIDHITNKRIENAHYFDKQLREIEEITVPSRDPLKKSVYHIYCVRAQKRDQLQQYLLKHTIDAKVHYPIPMHLQPAAKKYNYKKGDFPVAESICDSVISFPVHEFITKNQIDTICGKIREFYK